MNRGSRLTLSIVLNLFIAIVVACAGFWSGSLALISDALHHLRDAFALLISLFAHKLSLRPRTETRTFGFNRAEILAAFANSSILLVISSFVLKEAFHRLMHPSPVHSGIMVAVGAFGFIFNLISVFLLKKDSQENLNIRVSYLRLLSDAFAAIAIAMSGLGVMFFGWTWLDPLLSIFISAFVIKQGFSIFGKTLNILMQRVPKGIDVRDIQKEVEGIRGIKNIHHVHLWQLTEQDIFLEAHVNLLENMSVKETAELKTQVDKVVQDRFNINHSTLQFEYEPCGDTSLIKK